MVSRGSGVYVPFLFSPHEIGKLEELRESELPCVGRRFGEIGDKRKDRKWDEGGVDGGRSPRRRGCPILFWDGGTCRESQGARFCRATICRASFCRSKIRRANLCPPSGDFFAPSDAPAVLRAEPGASRCSGKVPRPRRRLRPVSDCRRSGARSPPRGQGTAIFRQRRAHAARGRELLGQRFRRFASAGEEQLFHWERSFQVA